MSRHLLIPVVWWTALVALAWWALAEGRTPVGPGAVVVVVTILATIVVGVRMRRPGEGALRLVRLPRFIAFFVAQSIVGGIDVARRALAPRGEVLPGMVEHFCRLPEGTPRALFIALVSVMPGTLVAGDGPDGLVWVHVIDRRRAAGPELRRIEDEIEALLGAG